LTSWMKSLLFCCTNNSAAGVEQVFGLWVFNFHQISWSKMALGVTRACISWVLVLTKTMSLCL
jgi:hypothetical protein